ncbi:hypothetical protein AX14_014465 [Amanita brunnescens Koide BX004]|nr:hypothetical protein AX14_000335 [Amanita brunnescens Koide BX004]KAF8702206.1 hypothetical protein AX14_014465 [Amanita brunnescens Koide BX004]
MKLLSLVLFSTLAAIALAQGILIGYPPANKDIHPGQHLTVQVVQPDSIEGPIIVGLAIGISSPCTTSQPCQPPSQSVGDDLYAGPFKPVLHQGQPGKFYQNYTVQVPTFVGKGQAQLNVVLFGLFGAASFPDHEAVSTTLNVV